MKTILYMGVSINGYIAKVDGNSEWTSREDLQGFYEGSKSAGNIVMGKNTFLEASKQGYFPFPDSLNVVVSHETIENKWGERVIITDAFPGAIVELLKNKGFDTVFLAGGGRLNSSFAEENLIDEIYIDIEPLLFGKGIQIFANSDFAFGLHLLGIKKLNDDTVQLHYQVKKTI